MRSTYGNQEGTAYNENVHCADDWQRVLEPIIGRYRSSDILRLFRGNAGFADPEIFGFTKESKGMVTANSQGKID